MPKTKKLIIGLVVCLIICSCLLFYKTQIAEAVTVIVNPGESIQAAIDSLPAEGGIVELAAGVHNVSDTIYINKSHVTIQGTHDSEIRSLNSSNDVFRVNLERTAQLENITFDGFSVTSSYGDGSQSNSLFMTDKVDNLTIKNINDTSWVRHFASINGRNLYYSTSYNTWILNNTIEHSNIAAFVAVNAEIAYNEMSGRLSGVGYGMYLEAGNTGISVHDNNMDNTGAGANIQTESHNAHIYNNTCNGGYMGITARYNTPNILIENNIVTGTSTAGIQFYSNHGLENQTARNNIIYGCSGDGIQIAEIGWATATGTSDVTLQNNVIYNCGGDGIGWGEANVDTIWTLSISNNIITNNTGYGLNLAHEHITETHSYNDIWGNTQGSYNNTLAGTGDISVDPFFPNASAGDFHLKSQEGRWNGTDWVTDSVTSPCIDAGDPNSTYSNEPSPNGGKINMGAYGNTAEASKSSGGCYAYKLVVAGESIQSAIDGLCSTGGTIELGDGTHNVYDTIFINRSNVNIHGTHDAIVKHHAEQGSWNRCFEIPLGNNNIAFDGFSTTSNYTWSFCRIFHAEGVSNFTVNNINDTSYAYYLALNGRNQPYPNPEDYAENIYFTNNTIVNGADLGAGFARNIYWTNNMLYGSIIDCNRNNINAYIMDNYIESAANYGIRIHGGLENGIISGNTINANGNQRGIYLDGCGPNITISNNIVTNATIAGIDLWSYLYDDITIQNNKIYNNDGAGIKTSAGTAPAPSNADIINNVIYNNTGDGIQMTSEYGQLNISNNIITNNSGYGINYIETVNPTTIDYNDIWQNALGEYNNTSAGTGDISADPKFASTTSGEEDFHLKSQTGRWNGSTWITDSQTSPCINAGDPSSVYSNESDHPNGQINMGAYGNTVEASLGSGGIDTTLPTRSNGSPTGILSSGTTSTNISLTTDENSTCKYSTTAGIAYASMPNTFFTTGATFHSQTISNLTDGQSYNYFVRCVDSSNNPNTDDYNISFSISNPEPNHIPIGNLDTDTEDLIIGWAYDLNAGTSPINVHIYIDGNLTGSSTANLNRPDIIGAGSGQVQDPNHGFSFSTPNDLSIGEHIVSVYAINQPEGDNPELGGSPKTFIVSSPDTTPPTGSILINSGDSQTNSQTANLTISATDDSDVSEMKISETNDFDSATAEPYSTIKSFILSIGDGIKTIYIWFKDTIGNWNASPYSDSIELDSTGPTISNIQETNITTNSATITFNTNELATSRIEYGLTSSYGSQTENSSQLLTFDFQLSDLSSDTTYHYRIISEDNLSNTLNSIDQTFKTEQSSIPDSTSPAAITDLESDNITQTSADLKWTSPGDDNNTGTASAYDIRYSLSNITESNWNSAIQISGEPIPQSAGTEQSIYIAVGLSPSTKYYFAIKTLDEVPNVSNISNILSFTTIAESSSPPGGGGGTISDTTPPSKPSNFSATGADKQITLKWNNPAESDFVRVKLLRKENSYPLSHNDSTAETIYEGTNQEYTDIELNNDTTYYYSIFAYDKKPNYSEVLSISSKPIKGKTSISNGNGKESSYPEGTLLKTPESFKIYIIINQKKKWIPTPEVFETLGYQWTSITEIEKTELNNIPNYEDNLIREINNYKVYLIVNGIKRHIPNPEIFLNYGFEWNDVKDVNQETINQYNTAKLIKESKQQKVYYLCPERKIRRWLRSPEIFNSYNNKWEDIQVISKYEMEHYRESNLIKLIGDNKVYLIENNTKRWIKSSEEFERLGLDWEMVMEVGGVEMGD